MPKIIATDRNGREVSIDIQSGESVITALRNQADAMVDENFGICGGCCSCSTCHVWGDESFQGLIPQVSPQEDDLLELADERHHNSRLGCQVTLTDALDGLRVTLPPAV